MLIQCGDVKILTFEKGIGGNYIVGLMSTSIDHTVLEVHWEAL